MAGRSCTSEQGSSSVEPVAPLDRRHASSGGRRDCRQPTAGTSGNGDLARSTGVLAIRLGDASLSLRAGEAARAGRGVLIPRRRSALLAGRPPYRVCLGPVWPGRDLGGRGRRIRSTSAHLTSMGMAGIAQLVAGWPHDRVRCTRSGWPRPCLDHSRRRRHATADHEADGRSNRADMVSRREMDLLFGSA